MTAIHGVFFMQLTQFTDYSLRALIFIALKNDICTITEISEAYGISRHHLVKIIHKLGKIGVIKTIRGSQGGVRLNFDPSEINLGDLVQKTEPNFHLVECFDPKNKSCCIAPVCKLKQILNQANKDFIKTLSQYSLADIISNKVQLKAYLKII